jgi:hypothetical protein
MLDEDGGENFSVAVEEQSQFSRTYSVWFTTRRVAPEKLVRIESVGEEMKLDS